MKYYRNRPRLAGRILLTWVCFLFLYTSLYRLLFCVLNIETLLHSLKCILRQRTAAGAVTNGRRAV